VRTFTKPELVEFIKSKLEYDQKRAELIAGFIFKARKLGAKDVKKRKKRFSKYGTDVSKEERKWRSRIKPIIPWSKYN
jgi:hypothetical protein